MNELTKLIEQSKLSPPFTKDDFGYIYDSNMVVVAQTRGWGHFQYLPNAEKLQDEFAQFIVDAMNEKLESRPTCGVEQRKFLDEIQSDKFKWLSYSSGLIANNNQSNSPTNIFQVNFKSDLSKVIDGD